ncbi:unnamed protein product [Calypogeia fissa]
MAPNNLAEPESTLPDILDYFLCLMDKCNHNDHSYCGHAQHQRRTRTHMVADFSSPPEEGNEHYKPEYYKLEHYKPQGSHSLSEVISDRQTMKDLEHALKATTKLHDLDTKTKAINKVNEWRVEQLNQNAEKSLEEDRRWAPTDSYRETMQELLKLHNAERDKWKNDRDKWKMERDSWKLTCKRLKDDASALEQQVKKLTLASRLWKEEFIKLASVNGAEGKDVTEACRDLHEQLQVEQQALDRQRRKGDREKGWNPQAPTEKVETPSDGIFEHFTPQGESDERKEKYNKLKVEDWVSQQQPLHLILEKQRWAKLRTAAVSQGKKLEEMCRDLLKQLEQRNMEIKRMKMELQKASQWQALAQQQIREQREEIKKLKRPEVAECIVCTNEFGEDPDQQRAYWKNCNHANICYKCTKTLWNSKNRQCPTCKTPASCMPTRLPPKIYL